MSNEVVKYEFEEVRAVRGTEPWSITKWEKDGWELVGQTQGTLSSTLRFRRPKPRPPWLLVGAVAAVVLIVGIGATVEAANGGNSHHTSPSAT